MRFFKIFFWVTAFRFFFDHIFIIYDLKNLRQLDLFLLKDSDIIVLMKNKQKNIEIYDSVDGNSRFYIAYSGKDFSTGIMVIKPGISLPKHNRPLAIENLTQISGKCLIKIIDEDEKITDYELNSGESIKIEKGKYHIHANPHEDISVTLWMADGDIVDIIETIRKIYRKVK